MSQRNFHQLWDAARELSQFADYYNIRKIFCLHIIPILVDGNYYHSVYLLSRELNN